MFSGFGLFKKVERHETEEKLNKKLEKLNEKLKKYNIKMAETADLRDQKSIEQKALEVLERKERCMGRLQELRARSVNEQLKEFAINTQNKIREVDTRADNLEEKVQKLAAELRKCKDQMAKLGESPAKNSVKQKVTRILKQKKMYDVNKIADTLEQSCKLQDALGRQYTTPEIDDDELDAELQALEDQKD